MENFCGEEGQSSATAVAISYALFLGRHGSCTRGQKGTLANGVFRIT